MSGVGKQGMAHQQGHGVGVCAPVCTAVCVAVHTEGHAGRALKLYQIDQGAVVSTQQKGMPFLSSALTMADAASQTELRQEHAAIQVSCCWLCPVLTPVLEGSSEHTCGRCTQEGRGTPLLSDRALGGGD